MGICQSRPAVIHEGSVCHRQSSSHTSNHQEIQGGFSLRRRPSETSLCTIIPEATEELLNDSDSRSDAGNVCLGGTSDHIATSMIPRVKKLPYVIVSPSVTEPTVLSLNSHSHRDDEDGNTVVSQSPTAANQTASSSSSIVSSALISPLESFDLTSPFPNSALLHDYDDDDSTFMAIEEEEEEEDASRVPRGEPDDEQDSSSYHLNAKILTTMKSSNSATPTVARLPQSDPDSPSVTDDESNPQMLHSSATTSVNPMALSLFHRIELQTKLQQRAARKQARKQKYNDRYQDVQGYKALWNQFKQIKGLQQQEIAEPTATSPLASSRSEKGFMSTSEKEVVNVVSPEGYDFTMPEKNFTRENRSRMVMMQRANSFHLHESSNWYFDFQSVNFVHENSHKQVQSALSLLSESSLEAQRRLYAEKRHQRKKLKKTLKRQQRSSSSSHPLALNTSDSLSTTYSTINPLISLESPVVAHREYVPRSYSYESSDGDSRSVYSAPFYSMHNSFSSPSADSLRMKSDSKWTDEETNQQDDHSYCLSYTGESASYTSNDYRVARRLITQNNASGHISTLDKLAALEAKIQVLQGRKSESDILNNTIVVETNATSSPSQVSSIPVYPSIAFTSPSAGNMSASVVSETSATPLVSNCASDLFNRTDAASHVLTPALLSSIDDQMPAQHDILTVTKKYPSSNELYPKSDCDASEKSYGSTPFVVNKYIEDFSLGANDHDDTLAVDFVLPNESIDGPPVDEEIIVGEESNVNLSSISLPVASDPHALKENDALSNMMVQKKEKEEEFQVIKELAKTTSIVKIPWPEMVLADDGYDDEDNNEVIEEDLGVGFPNISPTKSNVLNSTHPYRVARRLQLPDMKQQQASVPFEKNGISLEVAIDVPSFIEPISSLVHQTLIAEADDISSNHAVDPDPVLPKKAPVDPPGVTSMLDFVPSVELQRILSINNCDTTSTVRSDSHRCPPGVVLLNGPSTIKLNNENLSPKNRWIAEMSTHQFLALSEEKILSHLACTDSEGLDSLEASLRDQNNMSGMDAEISFYESFESDGAVSDGTTQGIDKGSNTFTSCNRKESGTILKLEDECQTLSSALMEQSVTGEPWTRISSSDITPKEELPNDEACFSNINLDTDQSHSRESTESESASFLHSTSVNLPNYLDSLILAETVQLQMKELLARYRGEQNSEADDE